MNEGGDDDQDVEQLVTLEPDVALAGQPALGDPQGVEARPPYVEPPHRQHLGDGAQLPRQLGPVENHEVDDGQGGDQAQRDEYQGPGFGEKEKK